MSDLSKLQLQSAELDRLDTEISERIRETEECLRAFIGVRVTHKIDDKHTLAFGKLDSTWQLIVIIADEQKPLNSCPRDMRARMYAGGILDLIRSASAQMERHIKDREHAIACGAAVLASLKGKP